MVSMLFFFLKKENDEHAMKGRPSNPQIAFAVSQGVEIAKWAL
jgi:hypothetical protein